MRKIILTAAIILPTIVFAQSDRVQCTSKTKKNTQCKNLAIIGRNICWQHDPNHVAKKEVQSQVCNGVTKSGTLCKNKTKHASGRCHHHRY